MSRNRDERHDFTSSKTKTTAKAFGPIRSVVNRYLTVRERDDDGQRLRRDVAAIAVQCCTRHSKMRKDSPLLVPFDLWDALLLHIMPVIYIKKLVPVTLKECNGSLHIP